MAIGDGDDQEDDSFFTGDRGEQINAFDIEHQIDWLIDQEYKPGGEFPVSWEDENGYHETTITLPGDFRDEDAWGDFYDDMRDWYESVWGDDDSPEGGSAKGG